MYTIYICISHFYFLFFPAFACCKLCMKCSDGKASPSTRQPLPSLQCSTRWRQVSLWHSRSLSPATIQANTHSHLSHSRSGHLCTLGSDRVYFNVFICTVCMYVCIYVYMYVCMYVHIYTYVYMYTHTYVHPPWWPSCSSITRMHAFTHTSTPA